MSTLRSLSTQQENDLKLLLAGKVASMMGRKFEEGDWTDVYCSVKNIPDFGWSNLNIDINWQGLGIEFKMLKVPVKEDETILKFCSTTQMHPSLTRSIRIEDNHLDPNVVMENVLSQYGRLIETHTENVRSEDPDGRADMRFGWLLWEDNLREFLYFEQPMTKPIPSNYYAEWHETPAKGSRKASRSLWIFDAGTKKKRYSVTTSAGIKIQGYFDVPGSDDPNLVYFCVQNEVVDDETIVLWTASSTAKHLESLLGSLDRDVIANAISSVAQSGTQSDPASLFDHTAAIPIPITRRAYELLSERWDAVSDEDHIRLLIEAL
ncbi:MAG: hypothetical protein KTV68_12110 [Acidimicrobiia bacterium]|nr:hypothetical protein [Acidimicrobiia bacterium]MCY4432919.1 hypothetical protein [bacterium]